MKICGIDFWQGMQHQFWHWGFALVWCLVALFLSWAILHTFIFHRSKSGASILLEMFHQHIGVMDILLWLGLWASLSVVLHCVGDALEILPVGWQENKNSLHLVKKKLEEKSPYEDKSTIHTVCEDYYRKFLRSQKVLNRISTIHCSSGLSLQYFYINYSIIVVDIARQSIY